MESILILRSLVFTNLFLQHHFINMLMSFSTMNDTLIYGAENLRTNWGNNDFFTFIRLPAGDMIPKNWKSSFLHFLTGG
jgi:putative ABC transport system permease protein